MQLKSLDPRVSRLGIATEVPELQPKQSLDQFETYEAFVQVNEGKDLEHVGPVHAPNEEMAFLFAKEQYSRRGMFCNALCVVKTEHIQATDFTDNNQDIYDTITEPASGEQTEMFEIFHLMKRGKQHKYVGDVMAKDYDDALSVAKASYQGKRPVFNIWVVKTPHVLSSDEEDLDLWHTLKEKQYRDAIDYRAQDKIQAFKKEREGDAS